MTDMPPEPGDLKSLGQRIDQVRRREEQRSQKPPPTPLGIAFRFTTEMVSALLVGGGLGWVLDELLGTHVLIVVFFILGAAAGIRNTMRAAQELNAKAAEVPPAPTVTDDEEES